MRLIERFFQTRLWKVSVATLFFLLFVSLGHLLLLADYSVEFFERMQQERFLPIASIVSDIYIWGIISCILLFFIFSAGLMDLFSYYRRVQQYNSITRVIGQFAAGDLSQRVTFQTRNELSALANTFNRMADTIVSDIEKIKSIDLLRKELVANVAHDLGGPVTSIQGYIETIMMKEHTLSAEERHQFLEIILQNAQSLSKLVGELSELSKFDSHELILQREPFSIVSLTRDIASRYKPMLDKARLEVTIEEGGEAPLVNADITLLERVLSNLLANAITHTPPGGHITFSFRVAKQDVLISVEDTGCGMHEKDLPHIFERFYRIQPERSKTTGGAGLGLAIVKQIIEAHGSRISVVSTPGKGSRFTFHLPIYHEENRGNEAKSLAPLPKIG